LRITGQENIAAMFGVTVKTIVEWQDQGMPVVRGEFGAGGTAPNEYESKECIAWLVERETGKVRGENPRDRLARLQADAIEMENGVKRGELIPASLIEPKMLAAVVSAREAFRNEPSRLSRMVGGKTPDEVEELVQQAFDGFLQRLSSWPTAKIEDDVEDEGDES
jgi:terminase small subunit / prophage DNA-packing protein